MLENFQPVPPDPILGLGQLYAADPREGKIDLGVGVFKDADGNTPIMAAVKKAEVVLHDMQTRIIRPWLYANGYALVTNRSISIFLNNTEDFYPAFNIQFK